MSMLVDWPYVRRVLNPSEIPTTDPWLVAIFRVESSFDPNAVRYEADYKYVWNVAENAKALGITKRTEEQFQKTSWGLGQIMGGTARWLGYKGPLTGLLDVETNVHFAGLYWEHLLTKYNGNRNQALAAYNAGNVKGCTDTACSNIDYVRKVMAEAQNMSKTEWNFFTGAI